MFKLDLEKAEEPEIKLPISVGSSNKQESSRKNLLLLCWLCKSLWLCGSQKNCGKFFERWEYQTSWPDTWENCMQVRKQQLELDMEHQTGSKWGKEYVKAVYCHPAYLIYMQSSTSYEMLSWMKQAQARIKIAERNINNLRYADDTTLMAECWVLGQLFHSPLSPSSRGSLVPLDFLPLEWYHLYIWGCWYFSQQSRFQLMIHPAWHFTYSK